MNVAYETGAGTREEQMQRTMMTPDISNDMPFGNADDWVIKSAEVLTGYAVVEKYNKNSIYFYTNNGNSSSGSCKVTYRHKYAQ